MIGQVYWNSHKKCYSIRDPKTRRVVCHMYELSIRDPLFKVSQKGYERRVREGVKNVYAWIEGEITSYSWPQTFRYLLGKDGDLIEFGGTCFRHSSDWNYQRHERPLLSCSWLLLDKWDSGRTLSDSPSPRMIAFDAKYSKKPLRRV